MPETINDWTPVVRSLLCWLRRHGIRPIAVDDGAERIRFDDANDERSFDDLDDAIADAICAVDEASLYCSAYADCNEVRATFWIVLGNEPEEIVVDYGHTRNVAALEEAIEDALKDFNAEWADKPCPRVALSDQAAA